MMEEDGLSLKDQCKILRQISAAMEKNDLNNITMVAPYLQMIPTDETEGDNNELEVTKLFNEISGDMGKRSFFSDDFHEGIKFFRAVSKGASDELGDISSDLETMQADLNKVINDARQSNATGTETVEAGKELKGSAKWWHFGRKFAAKKAIEQGDNTVKMSDRASQFATAIANDTGVVIGAIQENIEIVETTGKVDDIEGEEPPVEPTDDDGTTPPVSEGGTPPPSNGSDSPVVTA